MRNKVIVFQNDREIECDLLFTINDEKKNNKYVVCTDNTIDKKGNARVYIGKYQGNKIVSISNKEKEMMKDVIELIQEEVC